MEFTYLGCCEKCHHCDDAFGFSDPCSRSKADKPLHFGASVPNMLAIWYCSAYEWAHASKSTTNKIIKNKQKDFAQLLCLAINRIAMVYLECYQDHLNPLPHNTASDCSGDTQTNTSTISGIRTCGRLHCRLK
ncbi:conserved hypothetical protein [Trichinella spiralis]|uniref:hypothetical protein n=1 Tax=Trichinella spiralis TaxID=6334 RepID=UPI0001EFB96C|nr:conserved hypothetical protein [Trichinella spiralis]